jgi:hypothetical protein
LRTEGLEGEVVDEDLGPLEVADGIQDDAGVCSSLCQAHKAWDVLSSIKKSRTLKEVGILYIHFQFFPNDFPLLHLKKYNYRLFPNNSCCTVSTTSTDCNVKNQYSLYEMQFHLV